MQTYDIDQTKRKKAIKKIVKINVKNTKGFVKFCYGLTIFLRILAILLGAANILYVIFFSSYAVDIIMLIITFGFPYGLSFLPATVYVISMGGEYRLRKSETVTFTETGFIYSYHDNRLGFSDSILAFHIVYEKIARFAFEEKTRILTLYGKITGDIYENGELEKSDEYSEISLLDAYNISLEQLLEENIREE